MFSFLIRLPVGFRQYGHGDVHVHRIVKQIHQALKNRKCVKRENSAASEAEAANYGSRLH
ncbi:hypothetical protein CPI84_02020 [Erwinia pyrifoliae]|nr:hypothetical protein CPI84_02020 [Erwinia pyrifoliae]